MVFDVTAADEETALQVMAALEQLWATSARVYADTRRSGGAQ
ncbi:DUF6207 family protein [Streptomyces sp. NPDC049916]